MGLLAQTWTSSSECSFRFSCMIFSLVLIESSTDCLLSSLLGISTIWLEIYLIMHLANYLRTSHSSGSDGKESVCDAGNPGLIPGSGRSSGKGNGNPLQYSCLENSMDREACTVHGVSGSDTSWEIPFPLSLRWGEVHGWRWGPQRCPSLLTQMPAPCWFSQREAGAPGPSKSHSQGTFHFEQRLGFWTRGRKRWWNNLTLST